MPTIKLTDVLSQHANGQREIKVDGNTLSQVLNELSKNYTGLKPYLLNKENQLNHFMGYFINDTLDARRKDGLQTPLQENDTLTLLLATAGG